MAVVLDTCAWLWFCSDRSKLSKAATEVVRREQRRAGLVVSVFSAWEIAKLVEKRKLEFAIPCRHWIDQACRVDGITVYPLTPEICVESTELPGRFPRRSGGSDHRRNGAHARRAHRNGG
jgi:PIN domain nuclease of toxin-antitoxin system